MKISHRALAGLGLLALTTIGIAGCTINVNTPGSESSQGMHGSGNSAEFSGADLMFADMMIPHHQQAVEMSTLAETRSTNPEILALSQQIKAAQQPEIDLMQSWLDSAEQPGEGMDHSGHAMGGMLTPEQMDALSNASGVQFDRLYLEGMIVHHEGAIQMTRMIENSQNPAVQKLAEDIVRAQTEEIEQMKKLLTQI